jgi:sugar/nucleoside kinase (ribokinase family)/fructoselysine-6-P-deglycase FrlB-like protein
MTAGGGASTGAPSRPVVIVGNLTIDDVIQPDGTSQMATLGGNSVHACAAALAWAGDVGIVARCGSDFPAGALGRLRDAGADISGIRRIDGPTVRNWVIYEADGRRNWVYRTPRGRGAEVAPRPGDIPGGWLARRPPPVVHIAAMPLAAAAALARSVRDQAPGAAILLDTHEDWRGGSELAGAARAVDVFLPSREELAVLLGYDDPHRGAAELIAAGVRCVVVKLGADGALVAAPGGRPEHVPGYPVDVTDPTGAGDSFCGAFAAGLALGEDPVAAARRGCATAAAAIGAPGSLRLLDRRELARALLSGTAGGLAQDGRTIASGSPAGGTAPSSTPAGRTPAARDGRPDGGYDIGVMREEIATIPDVIAGHLADPGGHVTRLAAWLSERGIRHLYLTGCGDSAFAGRACELAFARHSGLRADAVHALDLARYRIRYLPPASAVVAVSFSGKAGRTTEAAVQAARFGHPVIALTNSADGPLAAAADFVLPIDVPTLGFSPGTSTYIAMVCTLLDLALRTAPAGQAGTARAAAAQLPGLAAKTLDWCDAPAAEAAARLASARFVTFLGAGPNEASAAFGAAKLFEAPQRIALAVNLEEWAHEQYFITRPGDPVVVIAPSGAATDRAGEIAAELSFVQADVTLVSDAEPPGHAACLRLAGGVPEEFSPVLAALPLAQAGFHLARLTGKRSYNFPSERAKQEHYATIHRVTVGEPA